MNENQLSNKARANGKGWGYNQPKLNFEMFCFVELE